MPTLVSDVVNRAIVQLSQVPGVSVQVYASARILQYVEDTFDMVWQQHWWDAYCSWWDGTLDGTTGRLTADIIPESPVPSSTRSVPITLYSNIDLCFPEGSNRIIREFPPRYNPATMVDGQVSYKTADYSLPNRPIKFYPVTSTGNVTLRVRQEPLHPFALTDYVYIDPLMLSLGAAYLYAADDGTNPAQMAKFQAMFTKRTNDMIAAESDSVLSLDPRSWSGNVSGDGSDSGIGSFTIGESVI